MERCENCSIARCGHDNGHGHMLGVYRKTAAEHEVELDPPDWCPLGIYEKRAEKPKPEAPAGGSAFERAEAALRAAFESANQNQKFAW